MTAKDLVIELWPMAAFIVTVFIAIAVNWRSTSSMNKRVAFLEGLITRQTISAEKAQERLYSLARAKWEEETGKPLSGDSEKAMEIAAGTVPTVIGEFTGAPSIIYYPEPVKFPKHKSKKSQR